MATPSDNPIRVMVDANILILASVWARFPYEVLQHAVKGDFQIVLCPYIITEARRYMTTLFSNSLWRFEETLTDIKYEMVDDPSEDQVKANSRLVRDAADIPIALAAINAGVNFFISRDNDFTDQHESTRELHEKLNIILPGTFLREYMGWTSEELEAIRERTWDDLK
jgi:predicted nucleic acid-binding protein